MSNPPSIIFYTDGLAVAELDEYAKRIEGLGYESLWVPEFTGRDPYSTSAHVLARTDTIKVATGIANLYSHDAIVAAQNRQTLAELSGGRFVLGLGVSHPPMAAMHGLEWVPPARKMRAYLDQLEATQVQSPLPTEPAPIWIAANGPKLLQLAADRCEGAHTYLLPPAHTKRAREILGPDKRLTVVVPCCLTEDSVLARKIARAALSIYMPLPAYQKAWVEWGFETSDYADGGSDRLIDSVVAWGDASKIRTRIDEHLDAGASHIAVSPYNPEGHGSQPHWKVVEALAP
jgi:probable F420-dependent oxidoreductase